MGILTNKTGKSALAILFYSLIGVFIVTYLRKLDFSRLSTVNVNWWCLIAAVPASVVSRVFLPYIWVQLIKIYEKVDTRDEYWQLNYVYAKSWLGRYIPGKVAWVGGKIYFALKRGISKIVLAVTSLVEAALQLLTALILGLAFLYISRAYSNFSDAYNAFFLAATLAGVIAVSPRVFNFLLKLGYRILKGRDLDSVYLVRLGDIVRIAALYFVVHSLSALPIYFLVRAVGINLGLLELLYVSGAFIFAGAVGTLAFFTPSGLGVREGVILLFLAEAMPVELGVVIVVLLRLWSVALDVFYWFLSYVVVELIDRRASSVAG